MNTRVRAIAISVIIFAALTYLFAWSSIFTVKKIDVIGLPAEVSASTIITKSKIVVGEKLARIEPRAIEMKLSEISWLESVSVDRHWAHSSVEIKVVPRIAVGLFDGRAIDASGTLFDLPGKASAGLPIVSATTPRLGLEAIALFTALPVDLRSSLISMSAVNESAISSWQVEDGRKLKVVWGSAKEVELKVSVFRALLALPENKNVKRVDLSAPHAPIVK
jgi:cell division septal protein FtsQ